MERIFGKFFEFLKFCHLDLVTAAAAVELCRPMGLTILFHMRQFFIAVWFHS